MMDNSNDFATGYAVGRDTNGNGYNNGNGLFNNDWAWIVILLLFGGWGGRGFGGFGGGFGGNGGCGCSPCATQADLAAGFNNSAVLSGINGIDSTLCQGFNGVNTAILQSEYNTQGAINGLSHQLAQCCCDNKAAIADVKYAMATESCATRNTIQNTTRDILENANANSRAILDALNANYIRTLESENNSLKLSASQANQNAVLMAAMDANKAEILRRTGAECPVPAYVVSAPTPVNFPTNCCGQVQFANAGCGCGSF